LQNSLEKFLLCHVQHKSIHSWDVLESELSLLVC
jgi:hypothetical protein